MMILPKIDLGNCLFFVAVLFDRGDGVDGTSTHCTHVKLMKIWFNMKEMSLLQLLME